MAFQCTFCVARFHCARDLDEHRHSQHSQPEEMARQTYQNELALAGEVTSLLRTIVDFGHNPVGQVHVELMEVFLELLLQILTRLRQLILRSRSHFHQRWQRYH